MSDDWLLSLALTLSLYINYSRTPIIQTSVIWSTDYPELTVLLHKLLDDCTIRVYHYVITLLEYIILSYDIQGNREGFLAMLKHFYLIYVML